MITLNTEKGLVEVETWEEILGLPGFMESLDPTDHKLKSILGRYVFKDQIACGLSDCHTLHNKGYIVETETGAVTNIGKDCGKREFGVNFETLSRNFESDIQARNNREMLATFSIAIDELQEKIQDIRKGERGADWLNSKIQEITHPGNGCPDAIVSRVNRMARDRQGRLTVERRATREEIDAMDAAAGREGSSERIIEDTIGTIQGLPALYPENNVREILAIQIEKRLKEFRAADIDSMTPSELREWVRWITSVDLLLERARAAVVAGLQFFHPDNLGQFTQTLTDRSDQATFRAYLKRLA
jgi:hypothetical protein